MAAVPRMKETTTILFFTLILLFLALDVRAEEQKIPPQGMDLLQVGATQVLVPAGTKIVRKDGLIILENIAEYVSRQVVYMNQRMQSNALDQRVKVLSQRHLKYPLAMILQPH